MCLLPEFLGSFERIDFLGLPPGFFIAGLMQLAMMAAAERHGELIAHLHADGAGLRKAQVVRIAGLPAADEAGLRGHEFEMVFVAQAFWFGDGQRAFVDL